MIEGKRVADTTEKWQL